MALPGLIMPPGLMAGAGKDYNIFLRGSAVSINTTSLNISSTGRQAGDLIIFGHFRINDDSSTIPAAVVPTGFTSWSTNGNNESDNAVRTSLAYKISNGSETTITGMSGYDGGINMALVFGGGPFASVGATTSFSESPVPDATPRTISPGSNAPVINIALFAAPGTTVIAGSSMAPETGNVLHNTGRSMRMSYLIQNSGSVSSVANWTGLTSNNLRRWAGRIGGYIQLT